MNLASSVMVTSYYQLYNFTNIYIYIFFFNNSTGKQLLLAQAFTNFTQFASSGGSLLAKGI